MSDNINFTQIKNWMPLITSSLIVAGAFFSVKTDIAVQTEKIEQMSQAQKDYLQKYDNSEIKLNNHETRITVLESRKQSTYINSTQIVSSKPTPEPQKPEEISKKPDNKAKDSIKEKEDPDPSPIIKLITPILGLLGGS